MIPEGFSEVDARFNLKVRKWFLAGLTLLSPLTALKVSELQSVEIYSLIALAITGAALFRNDFRIRASADVLSLFKLYSVFLAITALFAIFSLRLHTYPIPGTPLLKHAPFLSIARIVQFIIVISSLLITTALIAFRPSLCALVAQCYVYGGIVSCAYGIASAAALFAGVHLGGAYGSDHRIRGFFVEGGPFGVYLISVILVCLFRRHVLCKGDPRAYWLQLILFFVTLIGARSKAGILLGILLLLYYMFVKKKMRYVVAAIPLFLILAVSVHLTAQLRSYAEDYLNFQKLVQKHPNDTDLIEGRVMAAILVPIMVAHHPIAGIGIGNYSLQRNNPHILGPLPMAPGWDLPGLGLLGYAAELGVPLLIYLYWLLWRPVSIARRRFASPLVLVIAAYQTFAHTLGVQPTFVYPWIVSAIALGYCLTASGSGSHICSGAKNAAL